MYLLDRKSIHYAWRFLRGKLIHVNLQLLYDCNFRCRICDFWTEEFDRRPRLSLPDARAIADKLAAMGPMIVSVGGGEPLLHPDVVEIVRVLARRHFPAMITNGWLLTPAKARALFEAGIYEVSVSVDYADAARHDGQRGTPGAFDRARNALACLAANRVHPWQRVHMIAVVMDDNLDDLEPLILRCRDMGITFLVTLYSTRRGRGARRTPPDNVHTRLLDLHRRYPEFVQLRGYLTRFTEAFQQDGIGPCYAGRHLFNVGCEGEVTLCIDRLDDPVGNLLADDTRTIEARLLERYRTNQCRACWTSCRGAVESLRYGPRRLASLRDYARMIGPVPLHRA